MRRSRLAIATTLAIVATLACTAETRLPADTVAARDTTPDTARAAPRFDAFPVAALFEGTPAPVDWNSHEHAAAFRTRLRTHPGDTVDFAGHFRVVMWGCGATCVSGMIVDARTGRVHALPEPMTLGAEYRKDSRLFVADPPDSLLDVFAGEDSLPRWARTGYWAWIEDSGWVALDTAVVPRRTGARQAAP